MIVIIELTDVAGEKFSLIANNLVHMEEFHVGSGQNRKVIGTYLYTTQRHFKAKESRQEVAALIMEAQVRIMKLCNKQN